MGATQEALKFPKGDLKIEERWGKLSLVFCYMRNFLIPLKHDTSYSH